MDAECVAAGGVEGGDRGEALVVCVTEGCPGVAGAGDGDEVAGTIRGKGLSLSAKGGSTTGDGDDCDTVMP